MPEAFFNDGGGLLHGTSITWRKAVKKLYLASGLSAIRTRSEERLKTANGGLARAISKFNTHLSIFLWKNVSTEVGFDFAQPFEGGFQVFEDFWEGTSGFVPFSEPAT